MKLPRPILNTEIFELEIKKPNTDSFLKAAGFARENKFQNAAFAFLDGSIAEINGERPTISQVRNIPLISAELIIKEAFKLYGIDTKVESIHICPRCNYRIINEENEISDTRFDIDDLEVLYSEDSEPYVLHLKDPIIVEGKKEILLEVTSQTFRDITIGDLIQVENDPTLKTPISQMKKAYYMCLTDMDGRLGPSLVGKDTDALKKMFPFELMSYPDMRDFNSVTKLLRKYGIQNQKQMECPNCNKKFSDKVEFTSFFVSSLLSE